MLEMCVQMFHCKVFNSVLQFLTKLQCVNKWSKTPPYQISTNHSITKHNKKQRMSKQLSIELLLQPSPLFLSHSVSRKRNFSTDH
jgi:hypothetical protein